MWAGLFANAMAAEQTKIVDEGGIAKEWTLGDAGSLVALGYPAAFAGRGDNVCIAMGYAVQRDGSTSDFALLKAWSDAAPDGEPVPDYLDAFADASAHALAQWKFQPRSEIADPRTTYTVATMHFAGRGGLDANELRSHCRIDDLAGFIQQQKADRFYNGGNKHELERVSRLFEQRRLALAAAAARAAFEKRNK